MLALEKLPQDIRDFSHHDLFGTIAPANLPPFDFDVAGASPVILNQTDLDFCTGYCSSELNTVEFHAESDPSDPLYQMAKIKQIRGEWSQPEASLRDAADALITYGSLPLSKSPYTHNQYAPTDRDRGYLANWNNWPAELDQIAASRKLGSYFIPDGPYDAFDNIRSVLWQNASTWSGSGVIFGLEWMFDWNIVTGGVIPEATHSQASGGHAVYLRGQKVIDGMPYLVIQNSWGAAYGDNGLYYASRAILNAQAALGYGSYAFKKIPAAQIRTMI